MPVLGPAWQLDRPILLSVILLASCRGDPAQLGPAQPPDPSNQAPAQLGPGAAAAPEIAFVSDRTGRIVFDAGKRSVKGETNVYVMNSDGTGTTQLTFGQGYSGNSTWGQ